MQQVWTINGTYFAIGVLNRLKLLQKLLQPDIDSKSLSDTYVGAYLSLASLFHWSPRVGCIGAHVISTFAQFFVVWQLTSLVLLERSKEGVGMAMKTLKSLQSQINLQMTWKPCLDVLNLKAKEAISQLRMQEQHKKLKQVLIVSFIPFSPLVRKSIYSASELNFAEVAWFTCLSLSEVAVNQHWLEHWTSLIARLQQLQKFPKDTNAAFGDFCREKVQVCTWDEDCQGEGWKGTPSATDQVM
jgi:hypothetical protein